MADFSLFIARRLAFSAEKSFSRLIVRIAIAAVAISMAVMISAMAMIAGFQHEISRKIFGFWGHLNISDSRASLSFEPSPMPDSLPFLNDLRALGPVFYENEGENGFFTSLFENEKTTEKQTRGGVQHVQSYAIKPGIIQAKSQIEGILLKGIGRDFDWSRMQEFIETGQKIAFSDSSASRDILISRQTADRLGVEVGEKFTVFFVKNGEQIKRLFQISGIYKTGLEEFDRKFALVDIRQCQNLLGWSENQVAGYEVFIQNLDDLAPLTTHIHENLLPERLMATSIDEKFPAIFEWLKLQDYNKWVILGLMLAVAIINMVTALLILILERANMIGVLKALGERNGPIRRIFLIQAAYITGIGLFFGNLLGLGFCFAQDRFRFIRLSEADYFLSYAPVRVDFLSIFWLNIGALLVTVLVLIVPTWLVSRVSPVRAIRFK